jgi:hypothetical protein
MVKCIRLSMKLLANLDWYRIETKKPKSLSKTPLISIDRQVISLSYWHRWSIMAREGSSIGRVNFSDTARRHFWVEIARRLSPSETTSEPLRYTGGAKSNDPLRFRDRPRIQSPWSCFGSIIDSWFDLQIQIWIFIPCLSFIRQSPTHRCIKKSKDVDLIKTDKHKQRCVMKSFLLQGKRSNAIYGELKGLLGEAHVSLAY